MALYADNRFLKKTIERSLRDLPALPTVVVRVIEETQRPDVSPVDVERLIGTDQALTAKVLRVVNSAYYGLSGQVSSLGQALIILGMQQVRNMVLSVAALDSLQAKTKRQEDAMQRFWLHSFGTASGAQWLAQYKGLAQRDLEIAFTGGILHDIGKLFLFSQFTETYDEILAYAAEAGESVEDAEKKYLGLTHAEVGAEMAKTWKLPDALIGVIGAHEGNFDESKEAIQYAVHVADQLNKDLYDESYKFDGSQIHPEARLWLAFSGEEFCEMKLHIDRKIHEALELQQNIAA